MDTHRRVHPRPLTVVRSEMPPALLAGRLQGVFLEAAKVLVDGVSDDEKGLLAIDVLGAARKLVGKRREAEAAWGTRRAAVPIRT